MTETLLNLDWSLLHWIQETCRRTFLDFLMPKLTMLGNHGEIWILITLILLCTKKYRKYGVVLAVGLILCLLVGNLGLKPLLERARPCWLDPSVPLLIPVPEDYSFPSGHTLSSTTAAVILIMANRKFAFWAVPLAAVLAFSRLYLYVHFPSDILAAALIGIILAFAARALVEGAERIWRQRKNPPPPTAS